jgi:hypothetical protein
MVLEVPYEQRRCKVNVLDHNEVRYGTEPLEKA